MVPEKRAYFITDKAVEYTACLLAVHKVHVDIARVLYRILHRVLRDLVEGDPFYLCRIDIQYRRKMPAYGFPFAVRVGGKEYSVRRFCILAKLVYQLALAAYVDILRFEIVFDIDPEFAFRKIPDMALRKFNLIALAEKAVDCLCLARRFDDYKCVHQMLLIFALYICFRQPKLCCRLFPSS